MAEPKKAIQLIAALPIALVAIGFYYASNNRYMSHADGTVLIITTVDPAAPSANQFSSDVLKGIRRAKSDLEKVLERDKNSKAIGFKQVNFTPGANADLSLLLAKELSMHRILGVISAGTSQTDVPLAILCRHLRIPLLITVATNDVLTSRTLGESALSRHEVIQSTEQPTTTGKQGLERADLPDVSDASHGSTEETKERVVFRMLPNNTQQAFTIADFAKSLNSIPSKTGVVLFYEDNDYARALFDVISSKLKDRTTYAYLVDDSSSITAAMPSLEKLQASTAVIIYLGYSDHAKDFLQAIAAYQLKLPVVLSDGCWSPDLKRVVQKLQIDHLSIAFPTDPSDKKSQLPGFALYGYNAYMLFAHLDQSRSNSSASDTLDTVLNKALEHMETEASGIQNQPVLPPGALVPIQHGSVTEIPNPGQGQPTSGQTGAVESQPTETIARFSSEGEPENDQGKLIRFQLCDVPIKDLPMSCKYVGPEVGQ